MGGFIDPFMPSPEWPQDSTVFAGSSWSSSAGTSAAHAMEFHLRNGSTPAFMGTSVGPVFPGVTVLSSTHVKLHEEEEEDDELLLLLQSDEGLDFAVDAAAAGAGTVGAPVSLAVTDSAPASNESSGSEQSGPGLSHFLLGEQPAAWPPSYAGIIPSITGEEPSTQSFGFVGGDLLHEAAAAAACAASNGNNTTYQHHLSPPPLHLHLLQHDDPAGDFSCSGKLLSFAPPGGMDPLQMDQKEFNGGLHHLDLSSPVIPGPGPPPPLAAPFNATGGQNGAGGAAAPKPRTRARRGQATDPHSIAERLRREKISDRMKNLQELVPNSNKTDKASMLKEIIEYIKFLQLQTKVLSMSRLGVNEGVAPLLTESQNESSGLVLSPRLRSGEKQHDGGGGGGGGEELCGDGNSAAMEQEIAQLMENNMTAAMQYLQGRGLCLMPVGLASAISTKKGTSPAAVWPQPSGGGHKGHADVAGAKNKMN